MLPEGLTPLQEKALLALLAEGSVAGAARVADCGERTLHRWLNEDRRFKREYLRCRRQAFTHAIGIAQRFAPMAMANLIKIANDPSAPFMARVAASTAVLRFGRESIELDDLAERVESLEDRVVAEQGGGDA